MRPVRIIIFAKAPLPGLSKTRLIPALGAEGSAALARRLLHHTICQAQAAEIGPVELCVSPGPDHPAWQSISLARSIHCTDQGTGDLGDRLTRRVLKADSVGEMVLLIGTDCPSLDTDRLRSAAADLHDHDAVIVPASDGGYVLLGLKRFNADVFSGIPWSTASVASETLKRLRKLDWSVRTLPELHDIDEPDDLRWLPHSWQVSPGLDLRAAVPYEPCEGDATVFPGRNVISAPS